ncbi:hypothetical protein LCGC14_1840960, partial [marine sediment metagenome]
VAAIDIPAQEKMLIYLVWVPTTNLSGEFAWQCEVHYDLGPEVLSVDFNPIWFDLNESPPPPSTTHDYTYNVDLSGSGIIILADIDGITTAYFSTSQQSILQVRCVPYVEVAGGGNPGPETVAEIEDPNETGSVGIITTDQAGGKIAGDRLDFSDAFDVVKSAAERPIQGLFFDAMARGADSTGASDAATELQATATKALATGGRMQLAHGTYVFSGDLTIGKEVDLYGEGLMNTVLKGAKTALTSGTASSGGNLTLTDSGETWGTTQYIGKWVEITGNTGTGQIREILSHTNDVLTLHARDEWDENPDNTSTYKIYTPSRILVEGNPGPWGHTFHGIRFNGVQILYGATNADYGTGAIIDDCEIENAYRGVEYRYNSWLTKIVNSKIHNCCHGVFYDFRTPATNSGAAMELIGTDIFNCRNGLYVDEATSDGYHIQIIGGNIEHCWHAAITTADAGDNTIHWIGTHTELNVNFGGSSKDHWAFDLDGGRLFIDGLWYFATGSAEVTAIFRLDGDAKVWMTSYRLQWTAQKLVHFVAAATLVIDQDRGLANEQFFGKDTTTQAMSTGTSHANGRILNGGHTIGEAGGKVLAGQLNETTTLPAAGATDTQCKVHANEGSTRVLEFYLEVTVAGTVDQALRVDLNPGGSLRIDTTLPVVVGGGLFRVVYEPGVQFSVMGTFVDPATDKAYTFHAVVTDTHAMSVVKFMDFASISSSGTEATIVIRHLHEYVY